MGLAAQPICRKRSAVKYSNTKENEPHLLPNVLISEEEPGAKVFCRHVLTVTDDQFADTSEQDVFDRLRRDAAEIDHENRSISHPVMYSPSSSSSSSFSSFFSP